jgi:hypothetical protein
MASRKLRFGIFALAAAVLVIAVVMFLNRDSGPRHGGRYDEIADQIQSDLKFSRHFTWAVNTETIRAVRPSVGSQDADVLARMLGDERGTVSVAAASLLVLLGPVGEVALKRVAGSADYREALRAREGLMHLAQCRDPEVINLDRTMCPVR